MVIQYGRPAWMGQAFLAACHHGLYTYVYIVNVVIQSMANKVVVVVCMQNIQ